MKADSGTWVYIILSVVFLIISALGKKKQQPVVAKHESEDEEFDTPSDNEPPRKWPKSLEDVFTEVLDMPKQPEVVYSKPIKDEKFEKFERSLEVYEEEAKSLESIEEEAFSYETNNKNNIRIKEPDQPFVVYSENKSEESVPVFNIKDMDLRQGIIYAEILNRKYF